MNSNLMNAKDAISAPLAKAFMTIEGNRYEFIQLIEFKSKLKIKIGEVAILGKTMKGHKPTIATGEWSAKAYFNQSIFRKAMYNYKKTGIFPYFEIQVTNEDPSSAIGRQTVILKDCLIDGGVLAQLDANGDFLEEDLAGTYDDFEIPEKFSVLEGMI